MSAHLCDPCHLTALAVYAYEHGPKANTSVRELFDVLLQENVRSLRARYPKDDWWGDGALKPCPYCAGALFSPMELYKAARCYEYQACETDDWTTTRAHAISQRVLTLTASQLPYGIEDTGEYHAAAWGIRARHNECPPQRARQYVMSDAVSDMLSALERYAAAQDAVIGALVDKAAAYCVEQDFDAWVKNTEYPAEMRRALLAVMDLFVPTPLHAWSDAMARAQSIATLAGTSLHVEVGPFDASPTKE
jgi:hypothetical protein